MLLLTLALAGGCQPTSAPTPTGGGSADHTPSQPQAPSPPLVAAARAQIGVTTRYDPAYQVLAYPGGDVPVDRGVCTDVVVRALRSQGLDLQARVHEDMRGNFSAYPTIWGLSRPDRNIDHRRVPNLMRWFERQGWQQPITALAADYAAGDIVAWKLNGNGLLHVGIVSDRRLSNGTPLVLHNIARGTREE
ncbi:NADH:quinone oxidoreductase, partial [Stenotrophomonas africana]